MTEACLAWLPIHLLLLYMLLLSGLIGPCNELSSSVQKTSCISSSAALHLSCRAQVVGDMLLLGLLVLLLLLLNSTLRPHGMSLWLICWQIRMCMVSPAATTTQSSSSTEHMCEPVLC